MTEGPVTFLLTKISSILDAEVHLFPNIQEEVFRVRNKLVRIKAFLRTADSMVERDEQVKVWVEQIRDLLSYNEDTLDEYKLLADQDYGDGFRGILRMFGGYVRTMKARYRCINDLRSVSLRLMNVYQGHKRLRQNFKRAGQNVRSSDTDNQWQDHRSDALLLDKTALVGIEEPKRNSCAVPCRGSCQEGSYLCGQDGLAWEETMLVKQVYDDPVVKKHFAIHVWMLFSTSSKTEGVLKDMLHQIACQIRKPAPRRVTTPRYINILHISINQQ